jgi:hypothetical protein
MPLADVGVNLWKTCEVSYLQLDSYSTALFLLRLCEKGSAAANLLTNMALLEACSCIYSGLPSLKRDFG